jgi:hypothetical protein
MEEKNITREQQTRVVARLFSAVLRLCLVSAGELFRVYLVFV